MKRKNVDMFIERSNLNYAKWTQDEHFLFAGELTDEGVFHNEDQSPAGMWICGYVNM